MKELETKILSDYMNAPLLFSDCEKTAWGVLYSDPANPLCYDANRAVVFPEQELTGEILDEIKSFYISKGLLPRVFLPGKNERDEKLVKLIRSKNFTFSTQIISACMVKLNENILLTPKYLSVRRCYIYEESITENIFGEEYSYMPAVIKRSLENESFRLYVGFLAGEAVSMCAVTVSHGVACLGNVMTGMGFRKCGFAAQVIGFALKDYEENFTYPLYLLTENESTVPLYKAAGFEKINFTGGFLTAGYINEQRKI